MRRKISIFEPQGLGSRKSRDYNCREAENYKEKPRSKNLNLVLHKLQLRQSKVMSTRRNKVIRVVTIVLVIVLVVAIVIWLWPSTLTPSTPQIVEVTTCSISPSSVKVGQFTTITCATQSKDKNNIHIIIVKFSVQPAELVTFTMGSPATLTNPSPFVWQYNYTLNSLATYSQTATINASLQSGLYSAGYKIQITFYVDNNQLDSRTLNLAVNE